MKLISPFRFPIGDTVQRRIVGTVWSLVASLLACSLLGCTPKAETTDAVATAPREVELSLLVVDDPPLADAIERVAGEWRARSPSTVRISQSSWADLAAGEALPADVDAVIYPSALLGTLAERRWIAPLPDDYTQNRELAWSDTFELLQVAVARWGPRPMAVPLGSPVFTCFYRVDLFEKFHRRPPRTWDEYHELAEFFSRRENLGDAAPPQDAIWYGCVEPLGAGWTGRVLLARAAAYVKHRDNYSTLFNVETMAPLLGGAGFVRALTELVADAQFGPPQRASLDPDAVRETFLQGRCALAISWPGHQRSRAAEPAEKPPPTGFAELPGSTDGYNYAIGSWDKRKPDDSGRVPLLCVSGRLGSVCDRSAHPNRALRLLAWLSSKDWGSGISAVSSASSGTTLYRRSQMRQPQAWVDAGIDVEAARQYADTVRDALSRQAYVLALRIPGHNRYMAALERAVEAALAGAAPAEALAEAADEWTKITDQLGRDRQPAAYRSSLGLEP